MNKIHLYSCLALMVACGNPAKKDNMKEETTDKGLDLSAMDTSVRRNLISTTMSMEGG